MPRIMCDGYSDGMKQRTIPVSALAVLQPGHPASSWLCPYTEHHALSLGSVLYRAIAIFYGPYAEEGFSSQSPNVFPSVSVQTARKPQPGTAVFGRMTVPPRFCTREQ